MENTNIKEIEKTARRKAILEIAIKMLNKNLDKKLIMEITSLSEQELNIIEYTTNARKQDIVSNYVEQAKKNK